MHNKTGPPETFKLLSQELLIHAQAQTKAQAENVIHYFWCWCSSVRPYIRPFVQNTSKIKELTHFSSYSDVTGASAWIIVRLKSCSLFL